MKLLLITLLLFTYSRFIVRTVLYDSCEGKVLQGAVFTPNRCVLTDRNQNEYSVVKNQGNSASVSLSCDEKCASCEFNQNIQYGCNQTGPYANDLFYGLPKPISSTGFYFNIYQIPEDCSGNVPQFEIQFFNESICTPENKILFKGKNSKNDPKSQRLSFNRARNGVDYDEFTERGCKGQKTSYFFPSGRCSSIPNQPNLQIKVSGSL